MTIAPNKETDSATCRLGKSGVVPPHSKVDSYEQVELRARRELARRVVSAQELRVLEVILERSYGWGRLGFKVSTQAELAVLTGLQEAHVSAALTRLKRAWVLTALKTDDGVEFRLMPSAGWGLLLREGLAEGERLDRELKVLNGVSQPSLPTLEKEKSLTELMTETTEAHRGTQMGKACGPVSGWAGERVGEITPTMSVRKEVTESVTSDGLIGLKPDLSRVQKPIGGVTESVTNPPPLKLKAFKALTLSVCSLEELKLKVESLEEKEAMAGFGAVLGSEVWEGGTQARPVGDGGKWRNRWRADRGKVVRVFLALIEDGSGRQPGAKAEMLWKDFK